QHSFVGGAKVSYEVPELPSMFYGNFLVRDQQNNPVKGQKYKLTLPSGQQILGATDDNGMTVTGYSSSSDESLNLEIIEEVTQDIWFQPQTTYEYEQLNHIDSPLIDEDNGEINEE
ncbi:MAG: Ig-like domain-containing protein, partial [Acinetobacter sp.]